MQRAAKPMPYDTFPLLTSILQFIVNSDASHKKVIVDMNATRCLLFKNGRFRVGITRYVLNIGNNRQKTRAQR